MRSGLRPLLRVAVVELVELNLVSLLILLKGLIIRLLLLMGEFVPEHAGNTDEFLLGQFRVLALDLFEVGVVESKVRREGVFGLFWVVLLLLLLVLQLLLLRLLLLHWLRLLQLRLLALRVLRTLMLLFLLLLALLLLLLRLLLLLLADIDVVASYLVNLLKSLQQHL
jgi:hypothetical protein